MTFSGFPLALRFETDNITESFKKNCWQFALSAIDCTKIESTQLLDYCMSCHTKSIYHCIIHSNNLKEGRLLFDMIRANAPLYYSLSAHTPIGQDNYLEDKPVVEIGTLHPDGHIDSLEAGSPLPFKIEPATMQKSKGKLLVVMGNTPQYTTHECIKKVAMGLKGYDVTAVGYCDGGYGSAYVAGCLHRGRVVRFASQMPDGSEKQFCYHVITRRRAVIDGKTEQELLIKANHAIKSGLKDLVFFTKDVENNILKIAEGIDVTNLPSAEPAYHWMNNELQLDNLLKGVDGVICGIGDNYITEVVQSTCQKKGIGCLKINDTKNADKLSLVF